MRAYTGTVSSSSPPLDVSMTGRRVRRRRCFWYRREKRRERHHFHSVCCIVCSVRTIEPVVVCASIQAPCMVMSPNSPPSSHVTRYVQEWKSSLLQTLITTTARPRSWWRRGWKAASYASMEMVRRGDVRGNVMIGYFIYQPCRWYIHESGLLNGGHV